MALSDIEEANGYWLGHSTNLDIGPTHLVFAGRQAQVSRRYLFDIKDLSLTSFQFILIYLIFKVMLIFKKFHGALEKRRKK